MRLIFSFDFWRDKSFRERTDVIFIDIDTVSVWHILIFIDMDTVSVWHILIFIRHRHSISMVYIDYEYVST